MVAPRVTDGEAGVEGQIEELKSCMMERKV